MAQYRPKVSSSSKSGKKFTPQSDNFVEAIRDIGSNSFDSFKNDLLTETPKDFIRQLLGIEKPPTRASGEIHLGQSIEIDKVLESEKEENKILQAQLTHERNLRQNMEQYAARHTQELKLQLKAVHKEVEELAKSTVELAENVKIATMQAPVEAGVYHIVFFEKLLSFIKNFRKKINQANLWLQSSNKKAAKKRSFWGQVSKSGAKRLLSSEDYSQRSAG